jgi:hypothetical protein
MPASKANASKAPDVLSEFKVAPARKVANVISDNAKRASVDALGDGAFVARGTRSRDDVPVLVLRHGPQDIALPLLAIGAAIAQGVISRAEIDALLS